MERYNLALDHLEARIGESVDAAELARIARTSEHHFRRLFSTLAGMGLAEYVRRRRMTLAAAAIVDRRETVLSVAQQFGYASGDAFARAFRAVHGVGPDAARTPGTLLVAQPQLSFHLTTNGQSAMSYRIEQTPAMRIIGRTARLPLVHSGPNPALQSFVEGIPVEDTIGLKARNDVAPHGVLAVCTDLAEDRADGSTFTYLHGVATLGPTPVDAAVIDVPAMTWAVFQPADASDEALQALWPRVFVEWLPANDWRIALDLEVVAMQVADDGSLERTLWLPVARDV